MSDGPDQPQIPTAFEMLESVLLLITGAVVAGPMLPGLLLCVPVLVTVIVLVLVPVIALTALLALAGALLAMPFLLVRSVRGLRSRRAEPAPMPVRALATDM